MSKQNSDQTQKQNHDFFIRDSLYSLVELALLAKQHVSQLGSVLRQENEKALITQTMLRMKATEGVGVLKVAIHDVDPVAFYWSFDSTTSVWIDERFRNTDLEDQLLKSLNNVIL